jgi:hypothetical protein
MYTEFVEEKPVKGGHLDNRLWKWAFTLYGTDCEDATRNLNRCQREVKLLEASNFGFRYQIWVNDITC